MTDHSTMPTLVLGDRRRTEPASRVPAAVMRLAAPHDESPNRNISTATPPPRGGHDARAASKSRSIAIGKASNGDGGIYLEANGTFTVRWSYRNADGCSKRGVKRGFLTRGAASTFRRDVVGAVQSGVYLQPEPSPAISLGAVLLRDHLPAWLDGLRLKPQTIAGYRGKVRLHILPHLGELSLDAVTPTDLSQLYRHLERQGSPGGRGPLSLSSVLQVHEILCSAYTAAIRAGLVVDSPTKRADAPTLRQAKTRRPAIRTWTGEEVGSFLSFMEGDHYLPLWRVLASTGLRRGEVLGLQWRDIDLDTGVMKVERSLGLDRQEQEQADGTRRRKRQLILGPVKTDVVHQVVLDDHTVGALRNHRDRQAQERTALGDRWVDQGLVFCRGQLWLHKNAVAGGPLNPERISAAFGRDVKRAGVPKIRLHDLRHTWATLALKAGVSIVVVQQQLNHSDVSVTSGIYVHTDLEMARSASATVTSLFKAAGA